MSGFFVCALTFMTSKIMRTSNLKTKVWQDRVKLLLLCVFSQHCFECLNATRVQHNVLIKQIYLIKFKR